MTTETTAFAIVNQQLEFQGQWPATAQEIVRRVWESVRFRGGGPEGQYPDAYEAVRSSGGYVLLRYRDVGQDQDRRPHTLRMDAAWTKDEGEARRRLQGEVWPGQIVLDKSAAWKGGDQLFGHSSLERDEIVAMPQKSEAENSPGDTQADETVIRKRVFGIRHAVVLAVISTLLIYGIFRTIEVRSLNDKLATAQIEHGKDLSSLSELKNKNSELENQSFSDDKKIKDLDRKLTEKQSVIDTIPGGKVASLEKSVDNFKQHLDEMKKAYTEFEKNFKALKKSDN